MTIAIPNNIHKKMKSHPEIKWSEIGRSSIIEYIEKLEKLDKILKNSKMYEKYALELGELINRAASKQHK